MKINNLFFTALLSLILLNTACNKDEDEAVPSINFPEAAALIGTSTGVKSAGAHFVMLDAAKLAGELNSKNKQGETFDSTFIYESTPGIGLAFAYSFSYSYGLNTNSDEFNMNYSYEGLLSAPRIYSTSTSAGTFTLSSFEISYGYAIVNGTFERNAVMDAKFRTEQKLTTKLNITFTDVKIKLNTGKIESGAASVTISGSSDKGNSFNFSGSINYKGNGNYLLTLGEQYFEIDVQSGEIE